MTGRGDANLRAALAYAKAGWRVFPCIPGEKVPATSHGVKDATTGPAQIRAWWARNPDRNVAIATGAPGPDVLDVDRHGDASGFPALRQLKAAGIVGRAAALVRTPSGGAHIYVPGSEQGNGSLRGRHVDFRSAGGYVVAPPSAVGGRPYVVVSHQAHGDPIDWAKVREHLEPQRERQWEPPARLRDGGQNLDHLVARMADQPEGNRNGFLHWAANRVLDHGQDERLTELAKAAVAAGLDRHEVGRTIESARQTERQDPHAGQQPRGHAQLAPRHELESQPAARQEASRPARERAEPRARTAVLELDRDGPEVGERTEPSREPTAAPERAQEPQEPAQGRAEHPAAEPTAREPERERQAEAEPVRPFDPEPEPEREAGE
jgi:Bifunctional DNA primase/polymerase, N-terminal